MENIELKLESIDPTGIVIDSKTIDIPIYGDESMVKRRLFLHIGECLYRVDNRGYIIERLVPHHTIGYKMENIEEEDYNPYYKISSGCGVDGCGYK